MDLLNTNQSLNKGKTIYVDYKISKNGSTIRVFPCFFVNFSKKYVSIKGGFMSELKIYQTLRLN